MCGVLVPLWYFFFSWSTKACWLGLRVAVLALLGEARSSRADGGSAVRPGISGSPFSSMSLSGLVCSGCAWALRGPAIGLEPMPCAAPTLVVGLLDAVGRWAVSPASLPSQEYAACWDIRLSPVTTRMGFQKTTGTTDEKTDKKLNKYRNGRNGPSVPGLQFRLHCL